MKVFDFNFTLGKRLEHATLVLSYHQITCHWQAACRCALVSEHLNNSLSYNVIHRVEFTVPPEDKIDAVQTRRDLVENAEITQGSILGPTLMPIFINDISDVIVFNSVFGECQTGLTK